MKSIFTSFLVTLLLISCATKEDFYVVRQPAEFETQEAFWLIWPSTDYKVGESTEKVTLSIIEAIAGTEKIVITCKNASLLKHADEVIKKRFGTIKNITLLVIPSYDIWARDMGPIFVETSDSKMAIADFNFNFT